MVAVRGSRFACLRNTGKISRYPGEPDPVLNRNAERWPADLIVGCSPWAKRHKPHLDGKRI